MKGFRIFAAVFAVCLLVGGGGLWWLWRSYGGAVTSEFERMHNDAESFASDAEQEDCVPEAFARLEACDGVWCQVQTPIFTRACLRKAKPSPGLCEPVPGSFAAALLWPTTTCAEMDAEPEVCQRILRELVSTCFAKN